MWTALTDWQTAALMAAPKEHELVAWMDNQRVALRAGMMAALMVDKRVSTKVVLLVGN